jgi:para-aminobenzoate synthetase
VREGRSGLADELVVAVAALTRWRDASGGVTVVAIDGHGASGKSTIAEGLCARTGASLVHTDDFFVPSGQRAVGPDRPGPWRAPAPPAGETGRRLAGYYEMIRLRLEALEPLRAGHEAVFHAFDWDSGAVSGKVTRVEPSGLVLLEGVCSAAPELGDLVDRAIYVDTPEPERLRRLRRDVAPEDWDGEWLRAEKEYFAGTRPLESFDLVIRGGGVARPAPQSARAPGGGRRAGSSDDEEHRR